VHQQRAGRGAQFARGLQERRRQRPDAAFALDRLGDERARPLVSQRRRQRVDVVGRDPRGLLQRLEGLAVLLAVRQRQGAHRAAVEAAGQRDERRALGRAAHVHGLARELERALHRLGARVGEERSTHARQLAQPRRHLLGERVPEQVAEVHDLADLVAQFLGEAGMAVAERADGDAGQEVEELAAVAGHEAGAVAVDEDLLGAAVRLHQSLIHRRLPRMAASRRW
jgi:hypothetical protein